MDQGRGRCAVAEILTLVRELRDARHRSMLMKTTENFRNAEAGWVFNSLNLHGEHKKFNGKEERSLMKFSSSSFS